VPGCDLGQAEAWIGIVLQSTGVDPCLTAVETTTLYGHYYLHPPGSRA
jgi:hypothetical protein